MPPRGAESREKERVRQHIDTVHPIRYIFFCYMMTISCSARLSPHDREKHNKRWPSRRRADAKLPPALLPPRPPACPDMITNCLLRYQRRADETLAIKIPRSAMRTLTPAPRSSSFTPHLPPAFRLSFSKARLCFPQSRRVPLWGREDSR